MELLVCCDFLSAEIAEVVNLFVYVRISRCYCLPELPNAAQRLGFLVTQSCQMFSVAYVPELPVACFVQLLSYSGCGLRVGFSDIGPTRQLQSCAWTQRCLSCCGVPTRLSRCGSFAQRSLRCSHRCLNGFADEVFGCFCMCFRVLLTSADMMSGAVEQVLTKLLALCRKSQVFGL